MLICWCSKFCPFNKTLVPVISGSNRVPSNTYIEAAGVKNWNIKDQRAYGICMSLYEQHPVNGKMSGTLVYKAFTLLP